MFYARRASSLKEVSVRDGALHVQGCNKRDTQLIVDELSCSWFDLI
jgi:hypothetical protein